MKLTPILYEQLRAKHPQLRLPMWPDLTPVDKKRAKRLTAEQLIVRRTTQLLKRDPEVTDRVQLAPSRIASSWKRTISWIEGEPII